MASYQAGALAVHEYGDPDRPVLLLLHGITDSGQCWPDVVERLGSSYRIVSPDALGHGSSERFTTEQLEAGRTMEDMCASTIDLLEALGPSLVMGHSMGGGVAAAVTARRPDLVRAVVLEDPAWMDKSPWGDEEETTRQRVADATMLASDTEAAIAICRAQNTTWPESEFAPWAQAKADVDLDFVRTGRAMLDTPWREIASAIDRPALVLTGDGAVILHAETLAAIAELENPALDVRTIPGAAHCVRRDRADDFHALVDPWLAARG